MNKVLKYTLIVVAVLAVLWAAAFFIKTNSKSSITYETKKPFISNIEKKSVATGKVVPEEEVEIKPQISGIIEKIYLEEGVEVKSGDLIAVIKVVPNEQSLNQASGRVKTAQLALNNVKLEFERNKLLFEKDVISKQEYDNIKLRYDQALQDVSNAQADYQIIRKGSAGGSSSANTNIRATVSGTILEIPVEEGDQVIESNNFNDGTTIASIADLKKMIFEGKVDEGEVGKLKVGMPLKVSLGAVDDKEFDAKLRFIAPKGVEETGAVQFKIEGDVAIDEGVMIRAGYSANASFTLEKKSDVLVLPEALLQFDKNTDKPYVEVATGDQQFKRKDIEIGISDGVNVEILSGLTEDDAVKIWNKTEPIKKGDDEEKTTDEE
ncbi:efflux RND transporter periplasmic adaptor subunit [Cellulophaga omnivescoria]|uniref:efflux RND transporter periplasmic adaptor subunit n=1 Tax=Cellulophaga omnivescoria TaxID=1888890 RepID=UPI0022F0B5C7|nr:efflux RND transporter periplasmic adaptor subunit [Cellulophaga omnivescoria]WBU88085.1 efflux RND transporter periplasmic adaptor subunit [Cellulophaga omnivescoria]WKB80065.1 efflux RND transporter periplasmic adaptor subunit [Cellulophaga lytica]